MDRELLMEYEELFDAAYLVLAVAEKRGFHGYMAVPLDLLEKTLQRVKKAEVEQHRRSSES